jgi:hypothetical protein
MEKFQITKQEFRPELYSGRARSPVWVFLKRIVQTNGTQLTLCEKPIEINVKGCHQNL